MSVKEKMIAEIETSGKEDWEKVKAPDALSYRLQAVIANTTEKEAKPVRKNYWKPVVTVAAASLCVFTVALNTNEAFAKDMSNVPVFGKVASVLTVRSYKETTDDYEVELEQPAIQAENGISEKTAKEINQEIKRYMNDYVKQAKKDVREYKKAFLETGGTEAEFEAKDIKIKVSYEIKTMSDQYVSFEIFGYEDWNSATETEQFYNLQLPDLEAVSLEDLLGSDYKEIATQSILKEMNEQVAADSSLEYFTEDEGGFTSIDKESKFYINEAGNPVIVFGKYEIAPGYMGEPEFEINKDAEDTVTGDTDSGQNESSLSDDKIKVCEAVIEAVKNKDLESLAELTEYPFYFGKGDGEIIESKEDFLSMNPENVFTDELVSSVTATDLSKVEETNAGIILGDEGADIIISVKDDLKVSGINYK